jgi:hypothetical protein
MNWSDESPLVAVALLLIAIVAFATAWILTL